MRRSSSADCITSGTTGNVEPFLLGLLFAASAAAAVIRSCFCSRPGLVASSSSRRLVVARVTWYSYAIRNINFALFFLAIRHVIISGIVSSIDGIIEGFRSFTFV